MPKTNINAVASKKLGDFLVIWITGSLRKYIAEVTNEDPLILKVEETGPYARLKDGDFIVLEHYSIECQSDGEDAQNLLRQAVERGKPIVSGLKSLGVEDGTLHEILPVE